jgi:serine/threonine-protein kinase
LERTQIRPRRGYLEPGVRLSGIYEIDAPLAAGGMGEVYRGHAIETGEAVAIKVIKADFAENDTALDLFRREARALHNLFHEAIVRYYVFAIEPTLGRPYLAMEFVDGVSVAEAARIRPMAPQDVLALAHRIGAGLHAAHERQIIHRDVSPDNIIMPGGDVRAAKIIDFGIARDTNLGQATIIGDGVAGKYSYMSPEQANGVAAGPKSDMYSFGLVLAEAARGRALDMGGSLAEVVRKRMSTPDLSDVDASIRPLIVAMLAPDPQDRPASLREVAEWRPGHPIGLTGTASAKTPSEASAKRSAPSAKASPAHKPTEKVGRQGRGLLFGSLAAVVLIAAGGAFFFLRTGSTPGQPISAPTATGAPTLTPANAPPSEPSRPSTEATTASASSPPITQAPPPAVATAPPVAPPEPATPTQEANATSVPFKPPTADLAPLAPERIAEMAGFVRDYRGGECFVARATALASDSAQLEGLATTAEPLAKLNDAFKSKFGFEPDIGAWLIAPGQCAVTQFLSKARLDPALAPRLELGAANLKSGQYLTGLVEAPAGRIVELLQISDAGEAQNITAFVRNTGVRAFNLKIERATTGSEAKPQLMMAIASPQPLASTKIARPVSADKLLPALLAEAASRNIALGVTLRAFNLE